MDLTGEQGWAVVTYTAALSLLYVLPLTVVVFHTASVLIGEAGGVALAMLVLVTGAAKAFTWSMETFQ